MVFSVVAEESERERNRESMAMGTERSKPLHNFTLPCLRWGGQKHLRCRKAEISGAAVDRRSDGSRLGNDSRSSFRRREADLERKRFARDWERRTVRISKSKIDGGEGIEAVREKLMFDLKTAADKMKDAILREEAADDDPDAASGVAPPDGGARSWNLRTRRAACKAPLGGDEDMKPIIPIHSPVAPPPLRRSSPERRKFSVSLSRREIEDDYMAMVGGRLPRRPKKRLKNVQKQMDSLFPGLWLTEVSEDMYKVPELPDTGNR